MKRTFYHDGIEVDEGDLRNTEDTKIDEILKTRNLSSHFGVVEGLTVSGAGGSTATIAAGRAVTLNGEILIVNTPIQVTELSVANGVYTYIGLRYVEVESLEKPHEVDPVVEHTRVQTLAVASSFISSGATADQNASAKTEALASQNQTGTFVLLAEIVGTGTTFSVLRNAGKARSKGGSDPALGNTLTSDQLNGLTGIYRAASREEFTFATAEDDFHRSLVGSGVPNPKNPHGTTLEDLGFSDPTIGHQQKYHANGIIGSNDDGSDEFAPDLGTFRWNLVGSIIQIFPIQAFDAVHMHGLEFTAATNGARVDIDMTGQPAAIYYIMAHHNPANGLLEMTVQDKGFFDGTYTPFVNHGSNIWINNAVDIDGIRRFLGIGLVRWDGAQFIDLSTAGVFQVPGPTGELVYNDAVNGFAIPTNTLRLDLRRWGTITAEHIQRRTVNIDRLTKPIVTVPTFVAHTSSKVLNNGQSAFDDTVLSHLTNLQAFQVFGHRFNAHFFGAPEHPIANPGTFNAYPTLNSTLYGFQTNTNAWKQDNLTMTILKFSNGGSLNNNGSNPVLMDAAGDNNNANANSPVYAFCRPGYFMNFFARVGRSRDAGNIGVHIYVWRKSQGETPIGGFDMPVLPGGGVPQTSSTAGPFPSISGFGATIADPVYVAVALITPGGNSRNFTLTFEYHFVA